MNNTSDVRGPVSVENVQHLTINNINAVLPTYAEGKPGKIVYAAADKDSSCGNHQVNLWGSLPVEMGGFFDNGGKTLCKMTLGAYNAFLDRDLQVGAIEEIRINF